jgi:hypothetical protein
MLARAYLIMAEKNGPIYHALHLWTMLTFSITGCMNMKSATEVYAASSH